MFCTTCGSLAQEGARFCRTCGRPLTAAAVETAAEPPAAQVPAAVQVSVPAPPVAPDRPAAAAVRPLPGPYAGFWLRLVAHLIDGAIMSVVFGVLVAIAIATVGVRFFRGLAPGVYDRPASPLLPAAILGVILVLLPITIVVTWLYFASMESSTHQGTLGKIALGLFVTDLDGRPVSFGRATGRFFAKIITGLIPFFIGYIMAGFTDKKQALHDMIASCLVLKKV